MSRQSLHSTHLEKHPHPPSSAQCLLLSYDITCYWSIPLANLSQIWLCLLPISCPPFNQFTGVGAEPEKEKALTLCNHCSAMAKTLVCYQPWFSHKSKTPPQRLLWRKLTQGSFSCVDRSSLCLHVKPCWTEQQIFWCFGKNIVKVTDQVSAFLGIMLNIKVKRLWSWLNTNTLSLAIFPASSTSSWLCCTHVYIL